MLCALLSITTAILLYVIYQPTYLVLSDTMQALIPGMTRHLCGVPVAGRAFCARVPYLSFHPLSSRPYTQTSVREPHQVSESGEIYFCFIFL